MTRTQKIIFKIMGWGLLAVCLLYFLMVISFLVAAIVDSQKQIPLWYDWQDRHIEALARSYDNGSAVKIDEQEFCDFDIDQAVADGVRVNDLRMVATHNSYKYGLSTGTNLFYNHGIPLIMGNLYDYVYDPYTVQLNSGIRSFEIDLNKIKTDDQGGFELMCAHSPLLESNSTSIDIRQGLEEFKMWSDYNPNHMPVIVLVEIKGSGLLSQYVEMDKEGLLCFDNMIKDVFGEKLMTPEKVLGSCENMKEVREQNLYPTLGDSMGKFFFVLHDGRASEDFIDIDDSLKSQNMFFSVQNEERMQTESIMDNSLFLILNGPENEKIPEYIKDDNFMIRTRLDMFAQIDEDRKIAGMKSGAQILTTDYQYTPTERYDYVCKIADGKKTMILLDRSTL